jgi:hypothetical protein
VPDSVFSLAQADCVCPLLPTRFCSATNNNGWPVAIKFVYSGQSPVAVLTSGNDTLFSLVT